jgi:alpha-1,3-rhamnosyl/mannosyltransferase
MRVLINGVSTLKPKTGVGHTTVQLHRALTRLRAEDRFWLYPGEAISRLARRVVRPLTRRPSVAVLSPGGEGEDAPHGRIPDPVRPADTLSPGGEGGSRSEPGEGATRHECPQPIQSRWSARAVAAAKAAYRVHFRAVARWGGFDLYHEPNFVPLRTRLPTAVTVHDLSVLLHPEWHPADRVKFHADHFRRGVEAADHVIVVSESVRREVLDVLGLPPGRVTAVHNGIGDQFHPRSTDEIAAVRRRLVLPSRYLLAVGTIEPRKNIGTLLRAFCDLPGELREACPLVLAGGWGWKSEPERELFEAEARPRGVLHLGYVADEDLPGLYAGAAALLYPSFYEGFGLPPVEMLACGGAVVASTAAAVREVVGGHALLLDPHDLAGWRDAMRRVIADPGFAERLRRGGVAHAGRFTWDEAARKTFGVYQRVLGIAAAGSGRAAA